MALERLTQSEAEQLVKDWYLLLDVHAPEEQVVPLLADENLVMKFPEGTLHGLDEFRNWYQVVTNKFFDEIHELKELNIEINEDNAEVKLVVNWQAHVWNPPAAKSQWLGFDAVQSWTVRRSASGRPVIALYVVDDLIPMEGSATL